MEYIQTVRGKVSVEDMKACDSHTHLIAYATEKLIEKDIDLLLDSVDKLQPDMETFRNAGGNTIVEMTTIDYRRNLAQLKEVAEKYDLNIIAATGFNKGIYNRDFLENRNIDDVVKELVDEINNGEKETGIKPGVIKIGTSKNVIEPYEEKGLRAISRAHKLTGIPITTHTQNGTMAIEQMNLFIEEGVDLNNVVICHLDQNDDFDTHLTLINKGIFLSYDSVCKAKYDTRGRTLDFIARLAKENKHTQILLGNDYARRSCLSGYGGQPGYKSLFVEYKKELKVKLNEEGFTEEQIATIIEDLYVNNPRRAFRMRKAYA